jgi:hypothetical protein
MQTLRYCETPAIVPPVLAAATKACRVPFACSIHNVLDNLPYSQIGWQRILSLNQNLDKISHCGISLLMYAKPLVCALFDSLCAAAELFASKALLLAILTKWSL